MTPSRGIHSPNILLTYPVGSLCFWVRKLTVRAPGKRFEIREQLIPARVVDRSKHQGNKRLCLDVLFIGSNVTGANVLYVKRMPNVRTENIISAEQWDETRPRP